MVTSVLLEDALSLPLSSPLTASSEKRPLLHRSALHPVLLPSGSVHTRRFAVLFVRDFRLPWFALQVAASGVIATQPIASTLQCGILVLVWASIECNYLLWSLISTISTLNFSGALNPSPPHHPLSFPTYNSKIRLFTPLFYCELT
jgi:hypothetical protein